MSRRVTSGSPEPLGVHLAADGVNVAVFSEHATAVYLCLFEQDSDREEARIHLPARSGHIWHGHVAGVSAGQAYGLRAKGPFSPAEGHYFNIQKLLLDPYARSLSAVPVWSDVLVAEDPALPGSPDDRDSASYMPRCLVTPELPVVPSGEPPQRPWYGTVLYEAHVRGLTRRWPGMRSSLQGTFEALGEPQVIDYLCRLGITAVQLMPVHASMDEPHLTRQGLRNYWGYNSVSFFAPNPRYLGPGGLAGLRETVRRLHAAGLEVILDVVYNHTAEAGAAGPMVSFRGLDNRSYYALDPESPDGYANETGCGNRVNLAHPQVLRLVMDSLRWWVQHVGVDGFRFDLAPALLRGSRGYSANSSFLPVLLQDPVLRDCKLIAEPWDIGPGGYRLGGFPSPFAEWNDRFRDSVKGFWRRDAGTAAVLADGLLGSAQRFDHGGRGPWASINFVSCHDGFTLADLTRYSSKHNEANGESNRDGHNHNLSENFGVEGDSTDPEICAARSKRQRNLLATAVLAIGTPMLRAGDEIGHSQRGNNNAYCQDNELSWLDWTDADGEILAFVRQLLAIRDALPVLQQSRFLHTQLRFDGQYDVRWQGLDSDEPRWHDADMPGFSLLVRGSAAQFAADVDPMAVLLVLHSATEPRELRLPEGSWWCLLDTHRVSQLPRPVTECYALAEQSLVLFSNGNPFERTA
jgi:isoamylase